MQRFIEDGNGFLGIGSRRARASRARFFDGLIGARPGASSSTDAGRADRRPRRPRAPGDARPAAAVEPHRRLVHVDRRARPARSTRRALPRAGRARRRRHRGIGGNDTPISWCRDYRGGRSFYTGMGRTAAAYGEADFKKHLLGALAVDRRPDARRLQGHDQRQLQGHEDHQRRRRRRPASPPAASRTASSIANNGWVLYIGRGDCRTDAERGALLGLPSLGRILDHADPNVGIGCGTRPHLRPGAVQRHREQRRHARRQARGLRRRRPGRRADRRGRPQDGVRPARHRRRRRTSPRRATSTCSTSRRFNPSSRRPACRSSAASRRCRARASRASRSTCETKKLDLDSEVADLRVRRPDLLLLPRRRRHGLRLRGQPLRHHRRHELVAGLQRLLGQQPDRPSARSGRQRRSRRARNCGTANYSYQDARRTAGNTNDYNGKMLRIKPIADAPGRPRSRRSASGTTYDDPGRRRARTARTCSRATKGGRRRQDQARDLRDGPAQPEPPVDRPEDRRPVHGVGRPGRRRAERDRGPVDVRERGPDHARRQLRLAVLHGQQAGLPRPHRRRQPAHRQRRPATCPAVPATGGTDGWYDCDNLRNDSPNNTGLVVFPHTTGTGADAGKVRGNNLWYTPRQPGQRQRLPGVPASRAAPTAAPDYGATPTSAVPVRARTTA